MTRAPSNPLRAAATFAVALLAYTLMIGARISIAPGEPSAWPVPGYSAWDAAELLYVPVAAWSHAVLAQAAVDSRTGLAGESWPPAAVVRFALAESVYVAGHGMHVVANGLESARDGVFRLPEPAQGDSTGVYLHFAHEVVSHTVQWGGLILVVGAALAAEDGAAKRPAPHQGAVLGLALLIAAIWVPLTLGTRSFFVVAPGMLLCALSSGDGPLRATFRAAARLGLVGYAAWAAAHGGSMPTFDDLSGRHLGISTQVFESFRRPFAGAV